MEGNFPLIIERISSAVHNQTSLISLYSLDDMRRMPVDYVDASFYRRVRKPTEVRVRRLTQIGPPVEG